MKNQFIEVIVSRIGGKSLVTFNKNKIHSVGKSLDGNAVLFFGSEGSINIDESYDSFIDRLGNVDLLDDEEIELD